MRQKEQGFTLIELLGTITILGVIALIATGAYSVYLKSARDKAFGIAEKSMKNAMVSFFSYCGSNDYNKDPLCSRYPMPEVSGSSVTMKLSELIDGGYIEKIQDPDRRDTACKWDDSYVAVTSTEGSGTNFSLDYKICLVCSRRKSKTCT